MVVYPGCVAFRLVDDVDLFVVTNEHLGDISGPEQPETGTRNTNHHRADLGVENLFE